MVPAARAGTTLLPGHVLGMRRRRCVADAISQPTAEKAKWMSSYASLKTNVGKQTDLAEKL